MYSFLISMISSNTSVKREIDFFPFIILIQCSIYLFLTDSKKLIRPPCIKCNKDFCSCSPQTLYDSVMGDGKWIFREFVLYDQHKCYPEYVISYKRF